MNYQRSNELDFQKLSKTTQDISKEITDISNEDLIEYLENQEQKYQKRDNINLAINIICAIASLGAFITSVIAIFK